MKFLPEKETVYDSEIKYNWHMSGSSGVGKWMSQFIALPYDSSLNCIILKNKLYLADEQNTMSKATVNARSKSLADFLPIMFSFFIHCYQVLKANTSCLFWNWKYVFLPHLLTRNRNTITVDELFLLIN